MQHIVLDIINVTVVASEVRAHYNHNFLCGCSRHRISQVLHQVDLAAPSAFRNEMFVALLEALPQLCSRLMEYQEDKLHWGQLEYRKAKAGKIFHRTDFHNSIFSYNLCNHPSLGQSKSELCTDHT